MLKGGVVSYTNGIKKDLLGVLPETIARHTEVSEQCAAEMAQGARKVSGADIGVSATGYASGGAGVPEGMTRGGLYRVFRQKRNKSEKTAS